MTTIVRDAPSHNRLAPAQGAWRTLITHVQPDADARPRLAVAADLARRLDATLLGVGAEMVQPIAVSDPYGLMGGEFVSAFLEMVQENMKHANEAFREATADVRSEWVAVQDRPDHAMTRLSRGADLIVAGGASRKERDSFRLCDTGELIVRSGRPVLVAPPGDSKLAAEAIVIAWKDTREARRALADSLPILKCADDVVLLEVCGRDDATDVGVHHAAIVRHLASHGVAARSKVVPAGDQAEAADHLQAEAHATGADLIVAGGYGHSRMGEWAFGGLTAELLIDPQRFVLFSH
ncbi:universal stress protein [Phenylobacterium sp.]|jgi:nucleotide-binding universal stress UspA family protein|uniref:universal stress protein n=1 Tax=Phenylobacterium sp. TaxID=1871053 RepID=UPI002F3ECFE4